MNYFIRPLQTEDSLALIDLLNTLDSETPYTPYLPGERRLNAFQLATNMASGNQVFFGAESLGKIVGYIALSRDVAGRIQHNASLGMGVLQQHQRQGIGEALLRAAEEWAALNGVTRLELVVQTTNETAIRLYQKLGYATEGTKKGSLLVDGIEQDEYIMAKRLK